MKILVTGADGFLGRNLVETLYNIRDGKDKAHTIAYPLSAAASVPEILTFDKTDTAELLEQYCADCDFVFHLAGVNRPEKEEEFMEGNCAFTQTLIKALEKAGNTCPVAFASSVQATLMGRFEQSVYGRSKLAAEEALAEHGDRTGARILLYRFTNVFGKWCRPEYNSVVATFCYNIANDLPVQVNDENTQLELVYIDDLVDEMIEALNGREKRCDFDGMNIVPRDEGSFCYVPITHIVTLKQIVELLTSFKDQQTTGMMPKIPEGSFAKKLFSTYLSYLPTQKMKVELPMQHDARGSFTEVLKTMDCGQFSVNISKPGITKGEHWHHSKWEIFIVVSGHGLIRERKLGSDEIIEYEVSGEKLEAIYMLPGYTHSIVNLSETEDLITLIWINEEFDPDRPDTYREFVSD